MDELEAQRCRSVPRTSAASELHCVGLAQAGARASDDGHKAVEAELGHFGVEQQGRWSFRDRVVTCDRGSSPRCDFQVTMSGLSVYQPNYIVQRVKLEQMARHSSENTL
jgi:hypothetical protein